MRRRPNPVVERLERECDRLREELVRLRANPPDIPLTACDNSCVVANPDGMATNGGCRCDEQKLRRAVMYWRRLAQFRLVTIQDMRAGGPKVKCPTCRCLVVDGAVCLCCRYAPAKPEDK